MGGGLQVFGRKNIFEKKEKVALTIGNFDGMHVGHQQLIEQLKALANGLPTVIVTFDPHPSTFFHPRNPKPLLSCPSQKIAEMLKLGIDVVVVKEFDQDFASLSADDFCAQWLNVHFAIGRLLIGHDFCYGRDRQGHFQHLKSFGERLGWQVVSFSPVFSKELGTVVSSSLIRECLQQGNTVQAEKLLGRPYSLSGKVVQGEQRGRLLGFPTANLELECEPAIPLYGVYACLIEIEDDGVLHPGVMNCGVRPTLGKGLKLQIEAYILGFSQDIYHRKVSFHIKNFLRGEMKFASLEHLKQQIVEDVTQARKQLGFPVEPIHLQSDKN